MTNLPKNLNANSYLLIILQKEYKRITENMGLTIQGGCVAIALDEVCGTDNENTTDRKISS